MTFEISSFEGYYRNGWNSQFVEKKTALDGKWEVSYLGCSNGGAWKVCRLSRMCKCIGWGIEVDRERELADS